jgi:hypothetical protein
MCRRLPTILRTVFLALAAVVLVTVTLSLTSRFWLPSIGRSLVCAEAVASSDAIVVENFDPNYLLFERAAALQQAGVSTRVLVPIQASDPHAGLANPVSRGIAELMANLARVQNPETIPIADVEPYTLNAAYQLRDALVKRHLRSVVVVAPGFRSRRSSLVYRAVLSPAGIHVSCLPVFGDRTPENWAASWHGFEVVAEQFIKLQVYRWCVLRGLSG